MTKIIIEKDAVYANKDMIENGIYFKDGLKWHIEMFARPMGTSIIYIGFALIYLFSILASSIMLIKMFPLKQSVTIIMHASHPPETYWKKTHLKRFDTPLENVVMTMVERYLLERESYKAEEGLSALEVLEKKALFVSKTSSLKVYDAYRDFISSYNTVTGDFIINGTETNPTITLSEFAEEKKGIVGLLVSQFIPRKPVNTVKILFKTVNSAGVERRWEAKIKYSFNIERTKDKDKTEFMVTSYNVVAI